MTSCFFGEEIIQAHCAVCAQIAEEEAAKPVKLRPIEITINQLSSDIWLNYAQELGIRMDDVPALDSSTIEVLKSNIERVALTHSVSANILYIPTGLTVDKLLARFRPEHHAASAELRQILDDRPVERGYWTILTDALHPNKSRAEQTEALSQENFALPKVLSVLSSAIMVHEVSKKNLFEPQFYVTRDAYAEDGMFHNVYTRCLETPKIAIGASLLTDTCTRPFILGVFAEKVLS